MYKKYETPNWKVVTTQGPIEIRTYESYLSAEVDVEGTREDAANKGFMILANYIFGGNEEGSKIAMTTPVSLFNPTVRNLVSNDSGSWTIQFMMPSQFDLDRLPKTSDMRIRFRHEPSRTWAVIRFSGLSTNQSISKNQAELEAYLQREKKSYLPEPRIMIYDNPYSTLPWNRRNEVALEIAPLDSKDS